MDHHVGQSPPRDDVEMDRARRLLLPACLRPAAAMNCLAMMFKGGLPRYARNDVLMDHHVGQSPPCDDVSFLGEKRAMMPFVEQICGISKPKNLTSFVNVLLLIR